jgi:hypothetical protein
MVATPISWWRDKGKWSANDAKRKGSRKQLQGLMSVLPLRGLNRPTTSQTNSIAHVGRLKARTAGADTHT